jgi:hypothetical protein
MEPTQMGPAERTSQCFWLMSKIVIVMEVLSQLKIIGLIGN